MKFKGMSVSGFLGNNNIDLNEFYPEFFKEVEKAKKYNYLIAAEKCPEKSERKGSGNGLLKGLPVSVKDCICVKGMQSAAGSRILQGYKPPFDAAVVSKVRKAGGIIIGKTTQDEFGFGTFSVNSGILGGVPKNPHDPSRSCGGSSGGSAGLAAFLDYPHISLAESTGGSISCPAAFCGVAGLTPTYGLVSRYGLIDYANTLDKIGIISRRVEDCALGLQLISGHDPRDSTSLNARIPDYLKEMEKGAKGLRIAVPKEYMGASCKEIQNRVWDAIGFLGKEGASVAEVSLPMTGYAISAYYIIACSEASTNLAKYCGMRYGATLEISEGYNKYFSKVRTEYFGEEAKRRIMLGTYARMAGYRDKFYLRALKVRTKIIREFKDVFKKYDALVAPTMPIIAPRFSEIKRMSPLEQYKMDILTVAPNLAGLPHISVPCGMVSAMPVGVHIIGNYLNEGMILRIAHALEKNHEK